MAISIPIISEFDGKGIAKAKQEFAQLEGAGAKAQYAIKKAAIPAAAALAGVGAALFDATKAAIEDDAAQKQLALALKQNTKATDASVAATEDWISAQGRALGVSDDDLRPALAKLARQTHDVAEAQKGAKLAMDISAATGKDLSTVTDALAKAYGGNLNALSKLSPELKQLIKDGATTDEVMAKLAQTFGGAATTAANTAQGSFKRLQLGISETKESVGAALLPVIEKLIPRLLALSDWAQKNPEVFTRVALAIGAIATATVAVNAAMATNPYVLAAAGVVALAVAFERLFAAIDKISKVGGVAARILGALIGGAPAQFAANIPGLFGGSSSKSKSPTASAGSFRMFDQLNIPTMANGGIVNSPTLALIGEAGPEAVVPLDRAGSMGGTVNINVNGGDPNAVVAALRTYMRQNGSIPIKINNAY
jgi:hypothetical protein